MQKQVRLVRRRLPVVGAAVIVVAGMTFTAAQPASAARQSAGSGNSQHAVAMARTGRVGNGWVGTWSASPTVADTSGVSATGFTDQTVRDIVHVSAGGDRVRIRLSNAFGTKPLTISDAHLALERNRARVYGYSDRQLRFGGRVTFTIPTGAEAFSDPVRMRVRAGQNLAVSVFFRHATGPVTWHPLGQSPNYYSTSGDHAGDNGTRAYTHSATSWFFLDGIDVSNRRSAGAVVTLGDSITDGYHSTIDANRRWPDDLARRLYQSGRQPLSVLNEGISGNRILTDAGTAGVSAEARFDRDVLAQTGVRDVIFLEGINDIGTDIGVRGHPPVTARQLIAGMKSLIRRSHEQGLHIFGATLTPYKGAGYYTAAGERKRETVNRWIRDSGAFDGVIDFDRATRDPSSPKRFLPGYDSGDHLHPNDAGYQAMADAIPLRLLYRR